MHSSQHASHSSSGLVPVFERQSADRETDGKKQRERGRGGEGERGREEGPVIEGRERERVCDCV
jgi:hypothetical protein